MQTKRRSRGYVAALLALVLVGLWCGSSWGQGSGSSRTSPPRQPRRPQSVEEFARDFWKFLHKPTSSYTAWKTVVSRPRHIDDAPHGKASKTFLNSIAAGERATLPHGSILVMENTGADDETVTAVSVMYRVRGSDPANHDWYWMQFLPDGTLAKTSEETDAKPMAGRITACIQCHKRVPDDDLVFFNNEAPETNREEPAR